VDGGVGVGCGGLFVAVGGGVVAGAGIEKMCETG
jgi:F0F1-type ATP synthase membrane subunit c/vacuolar-type H+-ATPase subunit K